MPSLQNCHAHSLSPQKRFTELATYLAFFSVTYLATSLKLAKFSVTERTAGFDKRDGSDVCVVYCRDCTQTDTKSIRITVNTVSRTVYRKIVGHLGSYVMASAETFWLLLLYRYEKRILASLRR